MKSNIPRYSQDDLEAMHGLVKTAGEIVPAGKWRVVDAGVCDELMNATGSEDGWTVQLRLDCGWEVCEIDVGYDEADNLWAIITAWHWSYAEMPHDLRREAVRFESLLRRVLKGLEAGAMALIRDLTPALLEMKRQEQEAADLLNEAVNRPEGWKQETVDFPLEPDEMAY